MRTAPVGAGLEVELVAARGTNGIAGEALAGSIHGSAGTQHEGVEVEDHWRAGAKRRRERGRGRGVRPWTDRRGIVQRGGAADGDARTPRREGVGAVGGAGVYRERRVAVQREVLRDRHRRMNVRHSQRADDQRAPVVDRQRLRGQRVGAGGGHRLGDDHVVVRRRLRAARPVGIRVPVAAGGAGVGVVGGAGGKNREDSAENCKILL